MTLGPHKLRIPLWMAFWSFRGFWICAGLYVALLLSGWIAAREWAWRGDMIGLSRAVRPQYIDYNSTDFPLCILFAKYREDPGAGKLPAAGQFSQDPLEMNERVARLLALLGSLPEEKRPLMVGLDMTFPADEVQEYPYLAAAIAQLGNVVIAATEEETAFRDGALLRSTPEIRKAALAEALDTFELPRWSPPAKQPRLTALVQARLDHEKGPTYASLGVEVARQVALKRNQESIVDRISNRRQVPLFYWNLYAAGPEGDKEVATQMLGRWPAVPAAAYVPMIPAWDEGESPSQWLERARATFAEDPFADVVAEELAGRIILVATGHPHDEHPTPFTSVRYRSIHKQGNRPPTTPGVALHATAVSTLLKDRVPADLTIQRPVAGAWWVLLASLAGWWCGFLPRGYRGALLLASALLSIIVVDFIALTFINAWLPSFSALLAACGFYIAAGVESRIWMRRSREKVQQLLRRFTPGSSAVLLAPEEELGGLAPAQEQSSRTEWRTALLIDMAGYTPFLRAMEMRGRRDLLTKFISAFFSRVISVLDDHGGEVSDLTGDGLAAIFSQPDHALQAERAIRSAAAIAEAVAKWREEVTTECEQHRLGKIPVPGLRVGIGASETEIQLFGSEKQQRMVFFGGAFVLAARVEQSIKKLHQPVEGARHRICVEQRVLDTASEDFVRQLQLHSHGPVEVQGVEQPLRIQELIAINSPASPHP